MSLLQSAFQRPQRYYNPLSSGSDDGDSKNSSVEDLGEKNTVTKKQQTSSSNAVFYLTLICVVCTLANLLVLRITEYKEAHPPQPKNLRRPSQFPGLDRVKRPEKPIEHSIVNFPFVVARVDERNTGSVVPNNPPAGIANGNRIKVTKDISTVLQFRTLDWAMESCELTLRLPGEDMVVNPADNGTSSLVLGTTHSHIYIYKLVADSDGSPIDKVIDSKKLTYSSMPKVGEKVGSLHLEYGFEWSHKFPCEMDSLHAFVMVSADDSTHVEWWQDKQSILPAVYIEQHATK